MINNKKLSWIKWLLKRLVPGVFLLGGYLLLNTERGLETTVLFIKEFLPGQLKINNIQGRLMGPIQLKELYYQNNKINLYISKAQFDWQWKDLFHGKLNFGPIFIDKLTFFVNQKTSQKKSNAYQQKTYRLPKIFRYLKFNSVDIHQMNVQSEGISFLLQGSKYQQWNINWEMDIKDLNKFIPELQGKIALRGKIKGAMSNPEFNINKLAQLEPFSSSIIVPITKIFSHLSKHGLEASLQTSQGYKNQLFFYLLLPRYQLHSIPSLQQGLYANIDLNFKDLNFLTQLIPDLKKPKVIFNAHIKIKGAFNNSIFNLNLNLRQASAFILALGINLKNINYHIHTNKNNLIGNVQIHS